jgi:polyphenol oxidase
VSRNIRTIVDQELPDEIIGLLYLVGENNVVHVDGLEGSMTILDADGAVTNSPITLGLSVADCMPILLVDKINSVVGVAHGGWKGLAGGVLKKVLDEMINSGANAKNIIATIGPSICVNCYEVGEEVAAQFSNKVVDRSHQKPHVDLWKHAEIILKNTGVKQMDNLKVCTFENIDKYYSARAEGQTGRFLAYVTNS